MSLFCVYRNQIGRFMWQFKDVYECGNNSDGHVKAREATQPSSLSDATSSKRPYLKEWPTRYDATDLIASYIDDSQNREGDEHVSERSTSPSLQSPLSSSASLSINHFSQSRLLLCLLQDDQCSNTLGAHLQWCKQRDQTTDDIMKLAYNLVSDHNPLRHYSHRFHHHLTA